MPYVLDTVNIPRCSFACRVRISTCFDLLMLRFACAVYIWKLLTETVLLNAQELYFAKQTASLQSSFSDIGLTVEFALWDIHSSCFCKYSICLFGLSSFFKCWFAMFRIDPFLLYISSFYMFRCFMFCLDQHIAHGTLLWYGNMCWECVVVKMSFLQSACCKLGAVVEFACVGVQSR